MLKRMVFNNRNAVRQLQLAKGNAPQEGALRQRLQGIRQFDLLQIPAVKEGLAVHFLQILGQRHVLQAGTVMEYAKSKLLDRVGKYCPLQIIAAIQGIVRHFFRSSIPNDLPQAGILQAGIAHLHDGAGQGKGRVFRRIKGGCKARIAQGVHRIRNGNGNQAGAAAEGVFAHRLDPIGDHNALQLRAVVEQLIADLSQPAGQLHIRQAPAPGEGLVTNLLHRIGNGDGTQAGAQTESARTDLGHSIGDRHRSQRLIVVKRIHADGSDARLDDDLLDIGLRHSPLREVAGRIPNRSGALDGQGAVFGQGIGSTVTALARGRGGRLRAVA